MKASKISLLFLGIAFFLSGIASLIYQVAWQRILILHSGVGIYSVSVVVSAFMAGLGFGSYFGGVYSSKIAKKTALRLFALIEVLVGCVGLISCFVYYDLMYMQVNWLYSSLLTMIPAHFIALIIPTFLMGMSLPFLIHGTVYNYKNASATIGILYGVNIFGAVTGAFATPWLIIPAVGIKGATFLAAACNIGAGLFALVAGAFILKKTSADIAKEVEPAVELTAVPLATMTLTEPTQPFKFWILLYTISGFIALALEILWFRILDVAVKANAFTFGTILAVYLLGLGLGTFIGSFVTKNDKRPLRSFLFYQSVILIYSCCAILFMTHAPGDFWFMEQLDIYWGGKPFQPAAKFYLHIAMALFYCLVPTIFMGLSFTVLQKAVHNDPQTAGEKVGILQAFNILGNVLGSLAIGLLLINYLGTSGSLKFLVALGLIFPIIGLMKYKKSKLFSVSTFLIAVLIIAMPGQGKLWSRFHGISEDKAIYSENASGLVGLTEVNANGAYYFCLNGKYHSSIPFGGHHSFLGAFGAILHPNPKQIGIIGLGSGDTAWAAGCREETEKINVYEIVLAQDILEKARGGAASAKLDEFLDDERYTITNGDGRNALAQNETLYDILEADALRPQSAYSGNLYSKEFFQLCMDRLNEQGFMVQWNPVPRVQATFCDVFPYVYKTGIALIGSKNPINTDKNEMTKRLEMPSVSAYLGKGVYNGLSKCLPKMDLRLLSEKECNNGLKPNEDLFPRDEFILINHFYTEKK